MQMTSWNNHSWFMLVMLVDPTYGNKALID